MYQVYVEGIPLEVAASYAFADWQYRNGFRKSKDVYMVNVETKRVVRWTVLSVHHFYLAECENGAKYGYTDYQMYLDKLAKLRRDDNV